MVKKKFKKDIFELVDDLNREERNVESFLQIRMIYYDQEIEQRTDSISGVHPDYNYKFQFKIKPKNGEKFFTREELSKTTGAFYFTLYDEVRTDLRIFEKVSNTYSYKFEKKYLGSFIIPFSTIFQNSSSILESMCRVSVPLTLFGYYSDPSSHYIHEDQTNQEENIDNIKKEEGQKEIEDFPRIVSNHINTYISIYCTLDPVLEPFGGDEIDYVPGNNSKIILGFEDSIFLINSLKVLKELKTNDNLKNRNVKLFSENFDGYSVFIPRYIKAQKPPDIIISDADPQDPYSIQKAARFVSLIPFIDDSQAFDNFPECWCSSEQFLTLGFGGKNISLIKIMRNILFSFAITFFI